MDDTNLSSSARAVQDTLARAGLSCQVMELPGSTRTAPEAAAAVGCSVSQIVKSLVFRTVHSRKAVLILASGSNRVDEKLLAASLGEAIERADPDFVREQTGFAIGGIPPVGHSHPLATYMDEDLLAFEEIWAAAGTPHAVFPIDPKTLANISRSIIVRIH